MHFTSLYVSAALLGYAQLSHSKPIEAKGLEKRVDCDEISKYTIDYFMDNKIREPEASTCLFYTAYLSATAKRFAHSGGAAMTTIWDIWSCDHYNGDLNDDNNRLRCIFRDDNTRIEYFSHMSEAMAISCDIFATVMTNDPTSIPDDGIWATVEEPALQRTGNPGGQVDTIIAVDTSGGNVQTIWTRPGTLRVATNATEPVKTTEKPKAVKRQDDGVDRCYTPDQIQEWFGESVPW